VLDDLCAADGEQERKKVLVAAVKTRPDPVPARVRGIRDYVRILTDEPAMFDALRVLGQGVNHAAGIMSAIQHLPDRSKDPQTKHVTYFADLLNRMITEGLLVKAEQKVAGAYGRKVQHYQISSEGRHALQIAQWEISIKAEQQAMAAQRAKASPEGNSAPSDQGFATDPLLGT
jgi:DNA-binding PadR family transcriptional regulator